MDSGNLFLLRLLYTPFFDTGSFLTKSSALPETGGLCKLASKYPLTSLQLIHSQIGTQPTTSTLCQNLTPLLMIHITPPEHANFKENEDKRKYRILKLPEDHSLNN